MSDWVQWFCSMQGHDFFCEVDRDYIESRFNLYGLNQEVPTFSRCLGIILDYVSSDSDSDEVYRDSCVSPPPPSSSSLLLGR
jgi:casein kinase II subunit beta